MKVDGDRGYINISDHGLIGNMRTAALVSIRGKWAGQGNFELANRLLPVDRGWTCRCRRRAMAIPPGNGRDRELADRPMTGNQTSMHVSSGLQKVAQMTGNGGECLLSKTSILGRSEMCAHVSLLLTWVQMRG